MDHHQLYPSNEYSSLEATPSLVDNKPLPTSPALTLFTVQDEQEQMLSLAYSTVGCFCLSYYMSLFLGHIQSIQLPAALNTLQELQQACAIHRNVRAEYAI